jgi:ribose transport system permease protein
MSEKVARQDSAPESVPANAPETVSAGECVAPRSGRALAQRSARNVLRGGGGRNIGLVVALVLLCIVGVITAGDRFASGANVLTILRLAAVIGVVSVGMTFVITGGGIDLSVGALVALASVWATTLASQQMAADYHWIFMVTTALLVGAACGLVNGLLVAYGRIVPFIATLAMLCWPALAGWLRSCPTGRRRSLPSTRS